MTITETTDRLVNLALGDEYGSHVPGSRYGRRSEHVAPFAAAAHMVVAWSNGDDGDEQESLDFLMGLAVNDSAEIASMIAAGWHVIPRALRTELGGLRHVRTLAAS